MTPPVILRQSVLGGGDSEGSSEEQKVITVSTVQELQTVIKKAQAGDTIELNPGIYQVKLFIDKDLTIIGQGTSTIIVGGDTGTAMYAENCKLNLSYFRIQDSNSAIKLQNASGKILNMEIKNNQKSGIELRNSEFAIKNNIITENGSYGVFLDADSVAEIEGNYIENNKGF